MPSARAVLFRPCPSSAPAGCQDAAPPLEGLGLARSLAGASGLQIPARLATEAGTEAPGRHPGPGEERFTGPDRITLGLVGLTFLDVSVNLAFIPPP